MPKFTQLISCKARIRSCFSWILKKWVDGCLWNIGPEVRYHIYLFGLLFGDDPDLFINKNCSLIGVFLFKPVAFKNGLPFRVPWQSLGKKHCSLHILCVWYLLVFPKSSRLLRTYAYDITWKQSLCRCKQVKMKSSRISSGPKSNMTGVFRGIEKFAQRHRHTGKAPCDCMGRDQSDVSVRQGRNAKEYRQSSETRRETSEPSGEINPADSLMSDF